MILNPSQGGDESRPAVFTFISGRDVQSLCIDVYDNEDVCEPMAIGNVQLVNSTIIQAVEVSKAAIFIIDDDRKLTWMNWILIVFQMHTLISCAQNVYIFSTFANYQCPCIPKCTTCIHTIFLFASLIGPAGLQWLIHPTPRIVPILLGTHRCWHLVHSLQSLTLYQPMMHICAMVPPYANRNLYRGLIIHCSAFFSNFFWLVKG